VVEGRGKPYGTVKKRTHTYFSIKLERCDQSLRGGDGSKEERKMKGRGTWTILVKKGGGRGKT